eukprot:Em0011g905a
MGAMRVVVAAGEVVVGALVPILVPVVGLVQVAVGAALLLLLVVVGAALLLLLVVVGAALLLLLVVVGAALLLLLLADMVITGLVPRTTYTFSVTSYTITGPGTLQQFQTSTADIPDVTGVMVSAINTTSVRVSWLAVQLPPDGILTGYTVYYLSLPNTSKRQSGGYTNHTFSPTSTLETSTTSILMREALQLMLLLPLEELWEELLEVQP